MKSVSLFFIIVLLAVLVAQRNYIIQEQEHIQVLTDSLHYIQIQDTRLRQSYNDHMAKCSFIAKDDIKSWKNGIYIVLYHDIDISREIINKYKYSYEK